MKLYIAMNTALLIVVIYLHGQMDVEGGYHWGEKETEIRTVMDLPTQPRTVMELPKPSDSGIFRAICLWEGRGRIDLDAINESENAHGPAQIRQIYLDDSNQHAGASYSLQDCHKYEIAYKVVQSYWGKYNASTDEQRARMHNGGPKGHKRACTEKYWEGVKKYLN